METMAWWNAGGGSVNKGIGVAGDRIIGSQVTG